MNNFGLKLTILVMAITIYFGLGRSERQNDNLLAIDRQFDEMRRSESQGQCAVRCGFGLPMGKGRDLSKSFDTVCGCRARLESMREREVREIGAATIRQLSFAAALAMCAFACALHGFLKRPNSKWVQGI